MMQRLFLEYVTRYFGGVIIKAGFSEEEVLGLPPALYLPLPDTHHNPPSPPPPNLAFGVSPSILCTYGHGALNTSRVL